MNAGILRYLKGIRIFKSLQFRIVIVIMLFILIPTVFLLNYNFSNTESILIDRKSDLMMTNMEQVGLKVENICQDIMRISNIVGTDELIIDLLHSEANKNNAFGQKDLYNISSEERLRMTKVESRLNTIKSNFFNYNTHILIFGTDGLIYTSLDNVIDEFKFKLDYANIYMKQYWYKLLEEGNSSGIWVAPFSYETGDFDKDEHYISLARVVKSRYTKDAQAIIMANIGEENFTDLLGGNQNGIITLVNESNGIIFSSDYVEAQNNILNDEIIAKVSSLEEGYFFSNIDNRKCMVNVYSLKEHDWKLLSVIPHDDVVQEISTLKKRTFSINIILFGLFVLISIGLILYITYPLKNLIRNIRKKKIGSYDIGIQNDDQIDDVNDLVAGFNYLFTRIDDLVKQVLREQELEHDLRYEALRAQINPHFLFNTLNSIKWSAMLSGASHVSKMISSLGMLLEVSMNKGEDIIKLKDEIELIKSYLLIQNIRYSDKYSLHLNINEEVLCFKVPKLILQPIVENSIIHGFKDEDENGNIYVNAYKNENRLLIEVCDNGKGMSKLTLNTIIVKCSTDKYSKFSGIGLRNVDERLRIKYGKEYGLEIYSEEGKGTKIIIKLPVLS